jgi:septum site-determining protein MinD
MGEAIVVTSGKGGVGKTTTSANLGTALAMVGQKVCMVDTDIGLRNLDVVMGLENRIVYDLIDVAEGRCRVNQALIKDKNDISPEQVRQIIESLKPDFDYIIIDCPAGIEQGFRNAIAGASQAIVVTTPEHAAVRDADRVIGLLEKSNFPSPKLIINRIRPNMVKSGDMLEVDEICQVLAVDLIGIVPDDELVIKAANSGEPTVMNVHSRAAIAYRNIARRILGETVPLAHLDEKSGMFSRVKKFLGMG